MPGITIPCSASGLKWMDQPETLFLEIYSYRQNQQNIHHPKAFIYSTERSYTPISPYFPEFIIVEIV